MVEGGESEPHPHQGKVSPFHAGDPGVKLDNSALKTLESGKPYQTQIQDGSSGRGLVVQDVHAPTDIVWGRILNFDNYAKMVPNTVDSKNYHIDNHKNGHQTIYTMMKVGVPVFKLIFYVKHEYVPKLNSLTWTLDYSRKSDFDDSCGFWYILPHPDKPKEWTRVYYSVQVSMFDWVPKFVVNLFSTKALTDATAWVKKFSELEYAKHAKPTTDKDEKEAKQEKPRKVGWFKKFLKRQRTESATDDETCASSDDESSQDGGAEQLTKENMSLKRYALVAAVAALSLYNVHLYFSQ